MLVKLKLILYCTWKGDLQYGAGIITDRISLGVLFLSKNINYTNFLSKVFLKKKMILSKLDKKVDFQDFPSIY